MSNPNNQQFPASWPYIPLGIDMSRPPPPIPLSVPSFVNQPLISQGIPNPFPLSFALPPPPLFGTYPPHLMNTFNNSNPGQMFSAPPPSLPGVGLPNTTPQNLSNQKSLVM